MHCFFLVCASQIISETWYISRTFSKASFSLHGCSWLSFGVSSPWGSEAHSRPNRISNSYRSYIWCLTWDPCVGPHMIRYRGLGLRWGLFHRMPGHPSLRPYTSVNRIVQISTCTSLSFHRSLLVTTLCQMNGPRMPIRAISNPSRIRQSWICQQSLSKNWIGSLIMLTQTQRRQIGKCWMCTWHSPPFSFSLQLYVRISFFRNTWAANLIIRWSRNETEWRIHNNPSSLWGVADKKRLNRQMATWLRIYLSWWRLRGSVLEENGDGRALSDWHSVDICIAARIFEFAVHPNYLEPDSWAPKFSQSILNFFSNDQSDAILR